MHDGSCQLSYAGVHNGEVVAFVLNRTAEAVTVQGNVTLERALELLEQQIEVAA